MRFGFPGFAAFALAGCSSGISFQVRLGSDVALPVDLQVTAYDDGVLVTVPDHFSLVGKSPPWSFLLTAPTGAAPHFRVKLDGIDSSGRVVAQAAGRVTDHSPRLMLQNGRLPDRDGDGVPELDDGEYDIDDCSGVFDPNQDCNPRSDRGAERDFGTDTQPENHLPSVDLDNDPELMAWYRFDESDGSLAIDSTPNAGNGTLENAGSGPLPKHIASPHGSAIVLDGKEQYVALPMSAHHSAVGDFSLATWFKLSASDPLTGRDRKRRYYIVDLRGDGVNDNDSCALILEKNALTADSGTTTYYLNSYCVDAGGATSETTFHLDPAPLPNVWYPLALTRQDRNFTLYWNGGSSTDMAPMAHPLNFSHPKRIGNFSGGRLVDHDYFFSGAIDDLRVYTRALSTCEVMQLFGTRCL